MSIITSLLVPTLVGAVLAGGVSFGLVHAQNKAPGHNPATAPILTYGQPAT